MDAADWQKNEGRRMDGRCPANAIPSAFALASLTPCRFRFARDWGRYSSSRIQPFSPNGAQARSHGCNPWIQANERTPRLIRAPLFPSSAVLWHLALGTWPFPPTRVWNLALGTWPFPLKRAWPFPATTCQCDSAPKTLKSSAKMIPGSRADFFIKKSLKARRGSLGTHIMSRGLIRYAGGIFDFASMLGTQVLACRLSQQPDFQKSGAHERVDFRFDPANGSGKSTKAIQRLRARS